MSIASPAAHPAPLWRDYLQLTKPRIVALLVFTAAAALVVAARGTPRPDTLLATILGGALAAGGAGALNHYLDRDIDGQMSRTRHRPIPAGRVTPANALVFGLGLLAWATLVFGLLVNWVAAGLALFGAFYYVVIYTMLLKRNTALNIIIGGGAGAMPALVGWAAATGEIGLEALLLFAIIFFWTPPHSWALALLVNSDYQRTDVPMMPAAYGPDSTRLQILIYGVHLVILTLLPALIGMMGAIYTLAALALGAGLIVESLRLLRDAGKPSARRVYKYSSLYLALLFLAMIADQVILAASA